MTNRSTRPQRALEGWMVAAIVIGIAGFMAYGVIFEIILPAFEHITSAFEVAKQAGEAR